MRYQLLPLTAAPAHVVDQVSPGTLVATSTLVSVLMIVFEAAVSDGPVRTYAAHEAYLVIGAGAGAATDLNRLAAP
jgi:hypothetical protein